MMPRQQVLLATFCLIAPWTWAAAHAQGPSQSLLLPPIPAKSLPAVSASGRITRTFSAKGIETVVVRAYLAEQGDVVTVPQSRVVSVSGVPEGGAEGYHPVDPNWKETPASQWGLDFQAKAFGPLLVISSSTEILYIHHHYNFNHIRIEVPPGIKVVRENRTPNGEGKVDLSAPSSK